MTENRRNTSQEDTNIDIDMVLPVVLRKYVKWLKQIIIKIVQPQKFWYSYEWIISLIFGRSKIQLRSKKFSKMFWTHKMPLFIKNMMNSWKLKIQTLILNLTIKYFVHLHISEWKSLKMVKDMINILNLIAFMLENSFAHRKDQ